MSDAGVQGANGDERRRRTWSADQKQRIISESFAPGASVAEVARRYGRIRAISSFFAAAAGL
jgi:transposase-like protein